MAQRVITQLISDLTGDEIAAGKGETIAFTYRGVAYSIDVTDKEAAGFEPVVTADHSGTGCRLARTPALQPQRH